MYMKKKRGVDPLKCKIFLQHMFQYQRFEFQPSWFLVLIPIYLEFCNYFRIRSTWRSRACSCTLWNTCLTVAPTPSHDPWPWTFHLINQSAVARMGCFTMVVQWPLFELIMVSIFIVGQRTLFTVHWSDCCFQRPGHVSYVIASLW